MMMKSRSLLLALGLAIGAAPTFAQETTTAPATDTQAPATDTQAPAADSLSMGQESAPAENTPNVKATYGDWELRCAKVQKGPDLCELYQLLKDDQNNPIAEVSMLALPDGNKAAAGATVIVPLETLLTKQLQFAVDTNKPKVYPFSFCAPVGCFARIGFTAEEIAAMQKGNAATITVTPVAAPDTTFVVKMSLKGFTEAYKAIKAEVDAAGKDATSGN